MVSTLLLYNNFLFSNNEFPFNKHSKWSYLDVKVKNIYKYELAALYGTRLLMIIQINLLIKLTDKTLAIIMYNII